MSKQIEAELRASKKEADAAVDELMQMLDVIANAARGAKVQPREGELSDGEPIENNAVVMVPIPLLLMGRMATALNVWRRTQGTTQ